jgi:oligopeptide transport system substrate-binding protein
MKRGTAAALLAACLLMGCSRSASNVRSGDEAQELHRGIGPDLEGLDPQLAVQTSAYSVLSALLEGLTAEDPVDLHPVPGAAASWDVSGDGLTYTFHLREAKWSDGTAVTSDDFAGSWRRMLSPGFAASRASQLFILRGAEAFNRGAAGFGTVGVAAPDLRTLVVTLAHPAPWFPSVLSSPPWLPVPLAAISKIGPPDDRGTSWAVPGRWVGNGPFVLVSWRRGQEIVVARSPTYWDAANVRLAGIHFHAIDSIDAEERAFRSGQLHLTETLPATKIDSYRRDSPALLRIDPLLGTYFIRVNVRRPALAGALLRRQLSGAVDRGEIVRKILRGGQAPAFTFTPPGLGGAIAALDEALAKEGVPARSLGAAPAGLTLLYNTSEAHREVAEALQEMWRRTLGIQVNLINEELKGVEEARSTGNYDLLLSSWIADYEDPSAFLDILQSGNGDNFTGWSDPAYDALVSRADRMADPDARAVLYGQAERILAEQAPVIPLYHYTHVYLLRPEVKGWHPTLLDHHPYKAVSLGP